MQEAVRGVHLQLYADDTVLVSSGQTGEEAVRMLQPALNQFTFWCASNKLSLNTNKSKLMLFGTRQRVKKAKNSNVYIRAEKLQVVPTYKYLGFVLDTTLSFNSQVNNVVKTVAYKANVLAKIKRFLTDDVALLIYKSMIVPYFDYADVIYNTAKKESLEKLQRLQNRCLKICKGFDRRFDTKNLHAITKVPMLEKRRECHINNFMYSNLGKPYLRDVRDIRTRAHDAPLFLVDVPKNESYKRSIEYAGAVKWNALPKEIRGIDNLFAFKKRQKQIMNSQ